MFDVQIFPSLNHEPLAFNLSPFPCPMLSITPAIHIADHEIGFEFTRSSGPGGQNVNKVETAVRLRFDVEHSPSLPEDVRRRLQQLAGRRLTKEGVLLIEAQRHRTQEGNRRDALERFTLLVRQAAEKPKNRKPTRVSPAARRRRREDKTHRSRIKQQRRTGDE